MDNGRELGDFLKSRRARARPPLAGPRRRVPGLRREEVAQLAGISVEYYVRLEQGRAQRPSDEVLTTLAAALRLDHDERAHLFDLGRSRGAAPRPRPAERARPELVRLLATLDRVPALLIDHRLDVLAGNRLAAALFFDFDAAPVRQRNLARFAFLDPAARERFADWPEVARATVGQLRLVAGRHPHDEPLATLLGELTMRSEDFRTLWSRRDVRERTHGTKRFRHPAVGELTLRFENLDLPSATQRVVMFFADPGTPAEQSLELLAMWSTPALLE
ncbi:helix-turn-helix transcriptional regulator [Dactylosporangium sp. McL0621]|uniref:helix-turn-helix transcriptional regulator n=1 Tax=Dactylosporangium sp. McL0621 TaxID=3415678 RepID=UPI003CF9B4CF